MLGHQIRGQARVQVVERARIETLPREADGRVEQRDPREHRHPAPLAVQQVIDGQPDRSRVEQLEPVLHSGSAIGHRQSPTMPADVGGHQTHGAILLPATLSWAHLARADPAGSQRPDQGSRPGGLESLGPWCLSIFHLNSRVPDLGQHLRVCPRRWGNDEWNHFLPGIPYSPACQTAGLARPVVSHPE